MNVMKFSVGERVKIIAKGVVGEVQQTEYRHMVHKGSETLFRRYFVKPESGYSQWFNEDELRSPLELSKESLEQVNRILIDVNLMVGNFDMVKKLSEEIN